MRRHPSCTRRGLRSAVTILCGARTVTSMLCLCVVLVLSVGGAAAAADTRLVDAVRNRDVETARSLLKAHVDVNTAQPDGATALAWAAHYDDLEMANLLIASGA